jgi:aconitate hydratase
MGVLPLEFPPGENRESLGLTGMESYSITGLRDGISGSKRATVRAVAADGAAKTFEAVIRVDTPREADYYQHGGILPYVLRQLAAAPVGV